jgi:hypothetical protein
VKRAQCQAVLAVASVVRSRGVASGSMRSWLADMWPFEVRLRRVKERCRWIVQSQCCNEGLAAVQEADTDGIAGAAKGLVISLVALSFGCCSATASVAAQRKAQGPLAAERGYAGSSP